MRYKQNITNIKVLGSKVPVFALASYAAAGRVQGFRCQLVSGCWLLVTGRLLQKTEIIDERSDDRKRMTDDKFFPFWI